MNTLIASILAVEQEARTRIEAASKSASAKKVEAETRADTLIAQAQQQAASDFKARTEAAKAEAASKHAAGMQAIEAESLLYLKTLEPHLTDIASRAAMLIAGSMLD